MATFFDNKDRRVIPNFRSLKKTVELGELDISLKKTDEFPKDNIEDYFVDFLNNESLSYAGDLISAAIVNDLTDNEIVLKAAKFILERKNTSTIQQIESASKILKLNFIDTNVVNVKINKIDDFLEYNLSNEIHNRINQLKRGLLLFDKNPFAYSELARLYSIIGKKEQSIKNMRIAKHLAPHNRYILRSFARLMSHYGDTDESHNALRKNSLTKFDPWLIASEIAISSLRNKTSNFIKFGNQILTSKKFNAFSISELASSLGTVELINGSHKKSRSFFETALISPNDNSLAQVEWANNIEHYFELDVNKYQGSNNYEAVTLSAYDQHEWKKTLENAEKWFIDMPFAKRPIMFGHHVASFFLENHESGIKFCKAGLISNPHDPEILNNIAYSYAMSGDPENAFEYLNKINLHDVMEDKHRICLLATKGLAYYKSNLREEGRNFYFQAMKEAKQKGFKYYYNSALMNFALQELQFSSPESALLIDEIEKIPDDGNIDIITLKSRIREYLKKKKNT
ncbi:hypothetical protein BH10BAC2_BH10BAC2_20260 [soil metagenome]